MKKIFSFLMAAALAVPSLWAQNPVIYIHNCVTSSDLNVNLTPADASSDPQMNYNEATGEYTYEVIGWPKMNGSSAYNAKIFYSVDGDDITYYGCSGSMAMLQFNSGDTKPFTLATGSTITSVKGAVVYNTGTTESFCDVKIALTLPSGNANGTIVFTRFEGGQTIEIPTLENVNPKSGTTITPAEDGSVTITLTFSGKVKSLEALVDGTPINKSTKEVWNKETNSYDEEPTGWDNNISSNDDGTIWTLIVAKELIATGASEDGGSLNMIINKVTSEEGYEVTFDDSGSTQLSLSYLVEGVSQTSTLNIIGNEDNILTIYGSIAVEEDDVQYLEGVGTITLEGDTYEFPISTVQRFLFTVPVGYDLAVTSDLAQSSSNWQTGNAWTEKKVVTGEDDANGSIEFIDVMEGTYINVYPGAIGSTFNVTVTKTADNPVMYVSGAFNTYNPGSDSSYSLKAGDADDEEENIFTGYVENLEAGQFSLNFQYGNKYLIPASGASTPITLNEENNTCVLPLAEGLSNDSNSKVYWTNSTLEGEIGMQVNLDDYTVTFTYYPPASDNWYIRGAFNDYNPGDDSTWALTPVEVEAGQDEQVGVVSGTFNVPAGKLSFNFVDNNNSIIIPYDAVETNIIFENGKYVDGMDSYQFEGDELLYWVYPNWPGGNVTFTIDPTENTMTVTLPDAPADVYISGTFNSNNPNSSSEWKLKQDEDDSYLFTGYFEIPEGQFSFNFLADNEYLVPSGSGEVTFADFNFVGSFVEGDASSYWTNADWEGAELGVLVNFVDKTITLAYNEPVSDVWYISGELNDFNPSDDYAAWTLAPVEGENGVYSGIFTALEGAFKFNFINPEGFCLIPAEIETVDITFEPSENGGVIYNGNFDSAQDEDEYSLYWTYQNWKGGEFTVTLDINESTITITASEDSTAVKALDKVNGANDAIYNLQGVKVDSNKLQPGIYIINGKKVLVK